MDFFHRKTIFNIPTNDIIKGVLPFLAAEVAFLMIIAYIPQISLWLPGLMIGR